MKRRAFLQVGLSATFGAPLLAAGRRDRLDEAAEVLDRATTEGQVTAAAMHVVQRDSTFSRAFGQAKSADAMFLLGSISKPIAMTALMTLFDKQLFRLDDPLKKFISSFT